MSHIPFLRRWDMMRYNGIQLDTRYRLQVDAYGCSWKQCGYTAGYSGFAAKCEMAKYRSITGILQDTKDTVTVRYRRDTEARDIDGISPTYTLGEGCLIRDDGHEEYTHTCIII